MDMEQQQILKILQQEHIKNIFFALFIFIAGAVVSWLLARGIWLIQDKVLTRHTRFVLSRLTFATFFFITCMVVLHILGFHIAIIVGIISVVGLTLGVAGQPSISNVIAGLFILIEHNLRIDEIIDIHGMQGRVLSIDLLSTKIETFDGDIVRIPNTHIIDQRLKHISYPFDDIDMKVIIEFDQVQDLKQIEQKLYEFIQQTPYCIKEKNPLFITKYMHKECMTIKVRVFIPIPAINTARAALASDIKKFLDARVALLSDDWKLFAVLRYGLNFFEFENRK